MTNEIDFNLSNLKDFSPLKQSDITFYVCHGRTFKKIDLKEIVKQGKASQFSQWNREHRLVPTIIKGGEIFALVNATMAESIKSEPLKIDGKVAKVRELSADEFDALTDLGNILENLEIAETVQAKEIVSGIAVETKQGQKEKAKMPSLAFVFIQFEKALQKIKTTILKSWQNNLDEIREEKKEFNKKEEKKADDIKRTEIKRQLKRKEQ